jgi:hypothetical protein
MLYFLASPVLARCGGGGVSVAVAGQSVQDAKLIEAMVESLPQVYVQMTALLLGVTTGVVPVVSIGLSVLSIAHALAAKLVGFALRDPGRQARATAAAALYFGADIVARGLAVGMSGASHGVTAVGWAALFVGVDMSARLAHARLFDKDVRSVWLLVTEAKWFANGMRKTRFRLSSTLLSIFTSFPLTTARTEWHWLFALSTAFSVAMAAVAVVVTPALLPDAAPIVAAAVVLKSVAYAALLWTLRDEGAVDGEGATGCSLFALSNKAFDQMTSWTEKKWAAYHVSTSAVSHLNLLGKSYALMAIRGLVAASRGDLSEHVRTTRPMPLSTCSQTSRLSLQSAPASPSSGRPAPPSSRARSKTIRRSSTLICRTTRSAMWVPLQLRTRWWSTGRSPRSF